MRGKKQKCTEINLIEYSGRESWKSGDSQCNNDHRLSFLHVYNPEQSGSNVRSGEEGDSSIQGREESESRAEKWGAVTIYDLDFRATKRVTVILRHSFTTATLFFSPSFLFPQQTFVGRRRSNIFKSPLPLRFYAHIASRDWKKGERNWGEWREWKLRMQISIKNNIWVSLSLSAFSPFFEGKEASFFILHNLKRERMLCSLTLVRLIGF